MTVYNSPMSGVQFTLQAAGTTTGNGTVAAIPPSFLHHKVYIKGSSGVAAGAIQLESADAPDYAGTWAQIGSGPITVVASTELQIDFIGTYSFIRARVSTTVTTGTVTVTYVGTR